MMKKLFYTIVFCLIAGTSHANLLFSKTHILLNNNRRSDILEATNLSTKKMRYKVVLVNYKQLPNGEYEIVSDKDKEMSADNLIYVSPKSFILDNKETQVVRVMRKSLNNEAIKNLSDGEYRTHLVVQEVEDLDPNFSEEEIKLSEKKEGESDNMSIEIKGYMGMSIPVVFRKGNLFVSTKIIKAKKSTKDTKDILKIEIERAGNKSVRGIITILANNKEVGIVNNFAIYTENDRRFIDVPLDLEPLRGKKIRYIKINYKDSEKKRGKILSTYTLNNI